MTLKSRLLGLVTILALFAMAPSAFAQVTLTVVPDAISSTEVATSLNAQTAQPGVLGAGVDVTGTISAGNTLTTILRITYSGPITSSSGLVSTSINSGTGQSGLCGASFVNIGNASLGSPSGAQTPQQGEL